MLRWLIPIALLQFATAVAQQDDSRILEVTGRITDGQQKLQGCEVVVYEGNVEVGRQLTDRSGRFGLGLGMGKEFAILFQREGYLPKRVLVDTRARIPEELAGIPPCEMEMSLLAVDKYAGADTDVLDFPFAIVKWNRQLLAFVQDQEYTVGMMRANGAALLQAGRAGKP